MYVMDAQTIRDCFEWRKINTSAADPRLLRTHIANELHHSQDHAALEQKEPVLL
jgi:hypothetical protein